MVDGSGLSQGDRNRNGRLGRLRELLPAGNAVVGIDLAQVKQAAVVTDHDSQVVARRRVSCRVWELGSLLDWALERAAAAGFVSVTVAGAQTGPACSGQLAGPAGGWPRWRPAGAVLDELDLTDLACSIDGLTPVGAAAILAETGDLTRFGSPRAVVKHAGLRPRDNASGSHQGKTSISGKGRPGLRLAAWRAVWAGCRTTRCSPAGSGI